MAIGIADRDPVATATAGRGRSAALTATADRVRAGTAIDPRAEARTAIAPAEPVGDRPQGAEAAGPPPTSDAAAPPDRRRARAQGTGGQRSYGGGGGSAREGRPWQDRRGGDQRQGSQAARGGSPAGAPGRGGPPRDVRSAARQDLTASEVEEVNAARGSLAAERADLEAAEASPEALQAGKEILEELMKHLGFNVRVEVEAGETSRLNVVGDGDEKDALGALIGRKGERLSALQHLVNLMLSRRMDAWTRVLVDVEDYRGRRERQLRDLATRAAERVAETGKMLQLEPMPALERRWIHIALRDNANVATQSIGEEPNRRVVVVPRSV